MKRCAICEKPDCRCGMEMWEDDDGATAVAEPGTPVVAPLVRLPDTAGDRVAPVAVGVMVGFLIGFTLGVFAIATAR